jgi:hypothetical protein
MKNRHRVKVRINKNLIEEFEKNNSSVSLYKFLRNSILNYKPKIFFSEEEVRVFAERFEDFELFNKAVKKINYNSKKSPYFVEAKDVKFLKVVKDSFVRLNKVSRQKYFYSNQKEMYDLKSNNRVPLSMKRVLFIECNDLKLYRKVKLIQSNSFVPFSIFCACFFAGIEPIFDLERGEKDIVRICINALNNIEQFKKKIELGHAIIKPENLSGYTEKQVIKYIDSCIEEIEKYKEKIN